MFDVLDAQAGAKSRTRLQAVAGQYTVISASASFVEGYPAETSSGWRSGRALPRHRLRKVECFQRSTRAAVDVGAVRAL